MARRNSDEYHPKSFYTKNSRKRENGFAKFEKNGLYYFALYKGGDIVMLSQAYKSLAGRDNGVEAVKKNRNIIKRYRLDNRSGGKYGFGLFAANGHEIAISADLKSRAEAERLVGRINNSSTTPKLAPSKTSRKIISPKRRSVTGIKKGPKRRRANHKNNYKRLAFYEKLTKGRKNGIESFKGTDGKHYFAYFENSKIRLISQSYHSPKARDAGAALVNKNLNQGKRYDYSGPLKNGKYEYRLRAVNGKELARSVWYGSAAGAATSAAYLIGARKRTKPQPKIAKSAPKPRVSRVSRVLKKTRVGNSKQVSKVAKAAPIIAGSAVAAAAVTKASKSKPKITKAVPKPKVAKAAPKASKPKLETAKAAPKPKTTKTSTKAKVAKVASKPKAKITKAAPKPKPKPKAKVAKAAPVVAAAAIAPKVSKPKTKVTKAAPKPKPKPKAAKAPPKPKATKAASKPKVAKTTPKINKPKPKIAKAAPIIAASAAAATAAAAVPKVSKPKPKPPVPPKPEAPKIASPKPVAPKPETPKVALPKPVTKPVVVKPSTPKPVAPPLPPVAKPAAPIIAAASVEATPVVAAKAAAPIATAPVTAAKAAAPVAAAKAAAPIAATPVAAAGTVRGGFGFLKWLIPLLLLLLFALFGLKNCQPNSPAPIIAPVLVSCWDGSEADTQAACPVKVTCWDGSNAKNAAACPEQPVPKVTCWDGSLADSLSACPTEVEPEPIAEPEPEPIAKPVPAPEPVTTRAQFTSGTISRICGPSSNILFDVPNRSPKTLSYLGSNPQYGNSHGLTPAQFHAKLVSAHRAGGSDQAFLNLMARSLGYSHFQDMSASDFSHDTLANGSKGLLGVSRAHMLQYSRIETTDPAHLEAFRVRSLNGTDVHIMKTCGNYMYVCN